MTSCTIIISHFEAVNFLRACIRGIIKYQRPDIRQKIIVSDQSSKGTYDAITLEYRHNPDISIQHSMPLYSGHGLDYIFRGNSIETEYVCEIHADAVPINFNWLYLPITLMEENRLSFVGQLQFINSKENLASIYPPNPFFAMAQCFNVGKTEPYIELSFKAGFTRFHNRPQAPGFKYENNDWYEWAKDKYNERGSDDNIVAFHWQDTYREDNKLGLAITGFIESGYGRLIEDIVFHFGSANEARGVMDKMPELYRYYTQRINENYDDALIEEMVNIAKANKPPETEILNRNYWNGTTKESTPTSDEMNKRIEELKTTTK